MRRRRGRGWETGWRWHALEAVLRPAAPGLEGDDNPPGRLQHLSRTLVSHYPELLRFKAKRAAMDLPGAGCAWGSAQSAMLMSGRAAREAEKLGEKYQILSRNGAAWHLAALDYLFSCVRAGMASAAAASTNFALRYDTYRVHTC